MVHAIKLRKVGESIEGVFPEDVLDRLHVGDGDTLFLVERDGDILLTPRDPKLETGRGGV
jgi:antitoxin component of MazEF toxin-antitoxin module